MLYDTLIGPFIEFEFMRRALAGVVALSLATGWLWSTLAGDD